jgi:hypothetical protein
MTEAQVSREDAPKPEEAPKAIRLTRDQDDGISNEDRDGVTDACAYRRLVVSGSALAKAAIARAEQLAGRQVDRRVLAHGAHSHDGGKTWHEGH